MAQYNNKDQRNLEELLEEGWMDRLKARGAEALGSAKGVGQQIKGGLQQAAGSGLSKAGDWLESDKISRKGDKYTQQGQKSEREGGVSGHNAKVQYLQKNIDKRIDSFVADIKNDIKKLGLDIGNIEIVSGINAALGQLKKSVSGATPPPLPQQSGATPPPLPKQQSADGNVPPRPKLSENSDREEQWQHVKDAKAWDDKYANEYHFDGSKRSNSPYSSTSPKQKSTATVERGFDDNYDDEPENPVEYSYKKAISRKKKPRPTANPRKGKVRKDPFAKYAAPEQEEDLDKMFWED